MITQFYIFVVLNFFSEYSQYEHHRIGHSFLNIGKGTKHIMIILFDVVML